MLSSLVSGQSCLAACTLKAEPCRLNGSNPSERAKTGCCAPGDCALGENIFWKYDSILHRAPKTAGGGMIGKIKDFE
jgi:hypothetical protein